MIALAPNDSLGLVLAGSAVYVTATVFGETVPVGGGPPSPYHNAVYTNSTGWVTIATSGGANQQLLVNKVVVVNGNAATSAAVANFSSAPNSWTAGGANIGGGSNGYITIPPNGMAVYDRGGWRILTQYGNDVNVVQLGARCSAPSQALGAGGNQISTWTGLSQGTFATAAANGITLQREGSWFLSGTYRLLANIEHYLTFTQNGNMFFNDYPVGTPPGAASGAGISWSTIWALSAGDVISLNLFNASSPAAAAQGTTQLFAHWMCPYR